MRFGNGPLANTPTVVKNLVIINVLMMLVKMIGHGKLLGFDLDQALGLHYIASPDFKPWQLVTHMFMHSGPGEGNSRWFLHILMNMLGVFMLGAPLEYRWGSRRFLTFYMICGIGAGLFSMGVDAWKYQQLAQLVSAEDIQQLKLQGLQWLRTRDALDGGVSQDLIDLYRMLYRPMIGASGAVFGILVAFGLLYPNVELMIFPLPIPIKAKYFVMLYGAYELYAGYSGSNDGVAHFAHIGGAVVGFVTVMIWKRRLPDT